MTAPLVESRGSVALVGPAGIRRGDFELAVSLADKLVAADGGAENALDYGRLPDAVIGDFDSFDAKGRVPDDRLFHIREQDSTDFEKCLRRISARRVLALGFLGQRVDHTLAVLSVLTSRPPGACVLFGGHDVVVHCPSRLSLELSAGTRVSLFPMARVTGRSEGLEWPIDGLDFAPAGRIGTSNRATGPVRLEMEGPGMLLLLPREEIRPLLQALDHG